MEGVVSGELPAPPSWKKMERKHLGSYEFLEETLYWTIHDCRRSENTGEGGLIAYLKNKNCIITQRVHLFKTFELQKVEPYPLLFCKMECTFHDRLSTRIMGSSSFCIWLLLIFSVSSHIDVLYIYELLAMMHGGFNNLLYRAVFTVCAFQGNYGVNYGMIADNLPSPGSVVTLLKAAKIKNTRIYTADHEVLKAFNGSGIEIIVGLGNEFLVKMSVGEDPAMDWIKDNVQPFLPGTRIVGIAVGNEILGGGDQELWEVLLPTVKNVYGALEKLGLTKVVQVLSPHSEAVFENSYPPSSCALKEDVLVYMKPLLEFFSQTGSPFYINAYPFLAYKSDPEHIDINYALFKSNKGILDPKTKLHYGNMFEAQVDAGYAALEKAGFPKMEIIVSETGWASRGDPDEAGASLENARTYNHNLRKRLAKKKGTPYRPKLALRAYIFALFNENLKPGPTSERNFGLFKPDGSIAYDIGFTGLKDSSGPPSPVPFQVMGAYGWVGSSCTLLLTTCITLLLLISSS
ncbi:hypothetical protein SADUNF_Sadunf03G0019300 [Salix dunnii]|uniref:glucan endo-1,3-beta-D-glucosidase n=1 Tax=Salix dunnii TaxID=1413687 RepID=A0A835N361_9ROSI|nr:hypothetical protein SADUNF_Sadunf03G0019300 [Salix dunnii]